MGSSLARVTCETSQVLLVGGQVVLFGDPPFWPHLRLTQLKMSEIMLTGHITPPPHPPRPKRKQKETFISVEGDHAEPMETNDCSNEPVTVKGKKKEK